MWFSIATPTKSYFSGKKLIRGQSGKNLACGLQVPGKALLTTYGSDLALATPTRSCFGYLKLIKQRIRLKFGMQFPSNRLSIINHMCVCQWVWSGDIHTKGHHCACQELIYEPMRLKFGIWSPSNWVSIINYMWVWQCVRFGFSHTSNKSFWLLKAN